MIYSKIRIVIQILFLTLVISGFFTSLQLGWIIVLALLAGPIFCAWMCPFGTLQDILIGIRKRLNLPTLQLKQHKYLKWLRYILLIVVWMNSSTLVLQLLSYDPRVSFQQFLQNGSLKIFSAILLIAFLMCALFIDRFFCKYLCVEGARHAAISGARLFKIQRNETCVNCKKCDRTCPMAIRLTKSEIVQDMACITCLNCLDVCPVKGAIQIKANFSWQRMAIAFLLIGLLIAPLVQDMHNEKHSHIKPVEAIVSEAIVSEETMMSTEIVSSAPEILEGSARGFKSTITVQVQKTGDHIDSITVVSHKDDRKWYNRATTVIQDMIDKQTTDVDTVAGATYTSRGIINATNDALGLPAIE